MVNLYTTDDTRALEQDSRFRFRCHAGLACFNQCCRRPTIILRPFDILRLARHLQLTTTEFLERQTLAFREERSNLPLRLLTLTESGCPYLDPAAGCTVYPARPAACRLFPVTQGSRLAPGGVEDVHFLRVLPFCRGFEEEPEWTLAAWEADQDLAANEAHDRAWKDLLVLLGAPGRPPVDARGQELFTLALYDLDRFRGQLTDSPPPEARELAAAAGERLPSDDVALLGFGSRYLRRIFRLAAPGAAEMA